MFWNGKTKCTNLRGLLKKLNLIGKIWADISRFGEDIPQNSTARQCYNRFVSFAFFNVGKAVYYKMKNVRFAIVRLLSFRIVLRALIGASNFPLSWYAMETCAKLRVTCNLLGVPFLTVYPLSVNFGARGFSQRQSLRKSMIWLVEWGQPLVLHVQHALQYLYLK